MNRRSCLRYFALLMIVWFCGCGGPELVRNRSKTPEDYQATIDVDDMISYLRSKTKEDPEAIKPVLKEAVRIAVTKSPGLAIEIEEFASDETKKELASARQTIASLRQQIIDSSDSNAKILVVTNDLNLYKKAYKSWMEGYENHLSECKPNTAKLLEERDSANRELAEYKQRADNLVQQNNGLREEMALLSRENSVLKQNRGSNPSSDRGNASVNPQRTLRPVLIHNSWNHTNAWIRITHQQTGSSLSVLVPYQAGNDIMVVNLLTGTQVVDFFREDQNHFYRRVYITVTENVSITYNDSNTGQKGWYHGLIKPPN